MVINIQKYLVLLFPLFSLTSFSQDTVRIPQQELDEIIAVIDTLIEQDSINNILINQQEDQIKNYQVLAKQDSLLLLSKDKEINLYTEQIKMYEQRIKVSDKWWNSRQFGYITGVFSTIGLIWILNFTLP